MKKIAIPMATGSFCSHFGGAEAFTLIAVDEATGEVVSSEHLRPPEHGRGVFPSWLRRVGADVVLAGGMGPRAIDLLARNGIEVVCGLTGGEPEALVQGYLAGTLDATGEQCNDHGFHDCGQS